MAERRRFHGRFDDADTDPLTGMANLVDVMLVFACGLVSALVLGQAGPKSQRDGGTQIEQGRELPEVPQGAEGGMSGYESVGKVYRDPKTGKLVMVGE
jgi:hypothetical protein